MECGGVPLKKKQEAKIVIYENSVAVGRRCFDAGRNRVGFFGFAKQITQCGSTTLFYIYFRNNLQKSIDIESGK